MQQIRTTNKEDNVMDNKAIEEMVRKIQNMMEDDRDLVLELMDSGEQGEQETNKDF